MCGLYLNLDRRVVPAPPMNTKSLKSFGLTIRPFFRQSDTAIVVGVRDKDFKP